MEEMINSTFGLLMRKAYELTHDLDRAEELANATSERLRKTASDELGGNFAAFALRTLLAIYLEDWIIASSEMNASLDEFEVSSKSVLMDYATEIVAAQRRYYISFQQAEAVTLVDKFDFSIEQVARVQHVEPDVAFSRYILGRATMEGSSYNGDADDDGSW